ncbi:MAG: hypothetical protein HZA52_11425 [Planctomycetes bacterium]|nr:hypothetical protein [Planctomycetota bacterium]
MPKDLRASDPRRPARARTLARLLAALACVALPVACANPAKPSIAEHERDDAAGLREHAERARSLFEAGRLDEADALARDAWQSQVALHGRGRPEPRATARLVAAIASARGRHFAAAEVLRAVLAEWNASDADREPRFECTLALAAVLAAADRIREARDVLVELDLEIDATAEPAAVEHAVEHSAWHAAWHARMRELYPTTLRETIDIY